MSETVAWSIIGAALIAFVVVFWMFSATWNEVERKLGREPMWREVIFALLVCALAPPLSVVVAAAYVWWIMPERPQAKSANRSMTAPTVAKTATGA